jgi:hypothetical protein
MKSTVKSLACIIFDAEQYSLPASLVFYSQTYPDEVCSVPLEYLRRRSTSAGSSPAAFFLGTDNYQPEITQRLVAAGGQRYTPEGDLGPSQAASCMPP